MDYRPDTASVGDQTGLPELNPSQPSQIFTLPCTIQQLADTLSDDENSLYLLTLTRLGWNIPKTLALINHLKSLVQIYKENSYPPTEILGLELLNTYNRFGIESLFYERNISSTKAEIREIVVARLGFTLKNMFQVLERLREFSDPNKLEDSPEKRINHLKRFMKSSIRLTAIASYSLGLARRQGVGLAFFSTHTILNVMTHMGTTENLITRKYNNYRDQVESSHVAINKFQFVTGQFFLLLKSLESEMDTSLNVTDVLDDFVRLLKGSYLDVKFDGNFNFTIQALKEFGNVIPSKLQIEAIGDIFSNIVKYGGREVVISTKLVSHGKLGNCICYIFSQTNPHGLAANVTSSGIGSTTIRNLGMGFEYQEVNNGLSGVTKLYIPVNSS